MCTPLLLLSLLALPGVSGAAPDDQKSLGALPESEASKFREALQDALATPSAKSRAELRALAAKLETKYRYADLMRALHLGPKLGSKEPAPRKRGKAKEKFEEFDSVLSGLSFEHDGKTYAYAVDVPKEYERGEPAPLLLDPGHAAAADKDKKGKAGYLGYFRNMARAGGLPQALVVRTEILEEVGAGGRRGALPEDQVVPVFEALFADLASRFSIDLDRVYVAGLSQTGFWSWMLAKSRPDRFAGVAPMGAVTWQMKGYEENLLNTPLYVIHGDQDPTCAVAQPRATTAQLEQLGAIVHYDEVPGGKHDFSSWQRLSAGLSWLTEKGSRNAYPKRVHHALQTSATPWSYWLRVDDLKRQGNGKAGVAPTATLHAVVEGQKVTLTSEGVGRATIGLAAELLDLDQDVEVVWNGKTVHQGRPDRSFATAVEIALEKVDWTATFDAALELKAPR